MCVYVYYVHRRVLTTVYTQYWAYREHSHSLKSILNFITVVTT